jgi:hypothetical protein
MAIEILSGTSSFFCLGPGFPYHEACCIAYCAVLGLNRMVSFDFALLFVKAKVKSKETFAIPVTKKQAF